MKQKEIFYGFSDAEINGYVNQTLSNDTLQAMEKAIQQDADLKKELIRRIHEKRIQEQPQLLLWLAREKAENTLIWGLTKQTWAKIAVSIALLTLSAGAYAVFTRGASDSVEDTYNAGQAKMVSFIQQALNENDDRDVFTNTVVNPALNQALIDYRNKEYSKAEPVFFKLRGALQSEELDVYVAVCRLRMGKFKEARHILYPLLVEKDTDQSSFQAAVRWYLSLALVAEPKPMHIESAQQYLKMIPEDNRYKNSADRFLNELQKTFPAK
jgi:hypothetical protein